MPMKYNKIITKTKLLFSLSLITGLSLLGSPSLEVTASPEPWITINEKLEELYLDHHRSKRALVLFAPHIAFPRQLGEPPVLTKLKKRAVYGDACDEKLFNDTVLPVYHAAEQEYDSEFGTQVNGTATQLFDSIRAEIKSGISNSTIESVLQSRCIGWYPMKCTTEEGNGSPTCRCLNSEVSDTPDRHHPHFMHEGGRCKVIPGSFCRDHPQYKSGAKCARNGKCVNFTCVRVALSSEPLAAPVACHMWIVLGILLCYSYRFAFSISKKNP